MLLLMKNATGLGNSVVDGNGCGNFTTISEAITRSPSQSMERFVIYIKKGLYHEAVTIGEDKVSSHFLLKAVADACKVSATFVLEFNEIEEPDECESLFIEDQELEQVINGEIYMKVYPFSSEKHNSNLERKIILSESFNPLHNGQLKLLEVATSQV